MTIPSTETPAYPDLLVDRLSVDVRVYTLLAVGYGIALANRFKGNQLGSSLVLNVIGLFNDERMTRLGYRFAECSRLPA